MESVKQRFTDLETVVDDVLALFEQMSKEHPLPATVDEDVWYRARQAAHEWIANLVQHADFEQRTPEILLDVSSTGMQIDCMIEDNSNGFDLDLNLEVYRKKLEETRLPERGMGLLTLESFVSEMQYDRTPDGRCRLQFSVYADEDPCLNISF